MRTLILVIICTALGSCISITNAPVPSVHIHKEDKCPIFQLPEPEEVPQISELSEAQLKDRQLAEEALLAIIVEHRRYIRNEREKLNEAYIQYLQECN